MLKQTHWKLSRVKKRQEKYPKPQKGLPVVHVLFHVDVNDTETKRDGKIQNAQSDKCVDVCV